MPIGDIGAVIDTLIFDGVRGRPGGLVRVANDVYAVVYTGPTSDGLVATFTIDAAGGIGAAVIDTLTFETVNCLDPAIIQVSGETYAVVWSTDPIGIVATLTIDSAGNIGAAVVDTLQFEASTCIGPKIILVSGSIYAIAYEGGVGPRGQLVTVDIAANGQIAAAVTDTLAFETTQGEAPHIVNVTGTMYAIACMGGGSSRLKLITVDIQNNGNIAAAVTATVTFTPTLVNCGPIVKVVNGVFLVAYTEATTLKGSIASFTVSDAGAIGASFLDSLEFDGVQGRDAEIVAVAGGVYAIAYEGVDDDGFLKTARVDSTGAIGAVISTLEFDVGDSNFVYIIGVPGSDEIFAIAYADSLDRGTIKTCSVALQREGYLWIEGADMHHFDATNIERLSQHEGKQREF